MLWSGVVLRGPKDFQPWIKPEWPKKDVRSKMKDLSER